MRAQFPLEILGANLRKEFSRNSWRKFAPRISQEFLAQICAKNFQEHFVMYPFVCVLVIVCVCVCLCVDVCVSVCV